MDFFAIPRDVRDIIWAKNRVMLREERVRIRTYYVKEVLRELSEREFPSKSREVRIRGYLYRYNGISLSKRIGFSGVFSEPKCYNYLEIEGNTSKLDLLTNYEDYRLYGHKAHEAFISDDFKKYLINENIMRHTLQNENIYYDDDDDNDDNNI